MPYKRPEHGSRKYLPAFSAKKPGYGGSFDTGYSSDFIRIPLPNEKEVPRKGWSTGIELPGLKNILDFLREHIGIEEILLIGLIILLIDESFGDELLLIALIYILLF